LCIDFRWIWIKEQTFDEIIHRIEEQECDDIARILGQRNGRLSNEELELRLPPELIGGIAELGTSHGQSNEYWERARDLAEAEEQNLLSKDNAEIAALDTSPDQPNEERAKVLTEDEKQNLLQEDNVGIAALGASPDQPNEYGERARILAEEEDRNFQEDYSIIARFLRLYNWLNCSK
jgi:hypothetical protein